MRTFLCLDYDNVYARITFLIYVYLARTVACLIDGNIDLSSKHVNHLHFFYFRISFDGDCFAV